MKSRVDHLPEHWKDYVKNHPELSKGILTPEFNNTVLITWEDGSHSLFRHAFIVEKVSIGEICVFTEHCGYHCFYTRFLESYFTLDHKDHEKIQ